MEMFDLFGSFVNKICTLISFLTTFSHVLHYGPLEGSKDGKAEVLNFLDDLPDYSWQEPNPDDPLSLVDKVTHNNTTSLNSDLEHNMLCTTCVHTKLLSLYWPRWRFLLHTSARILWAGETFCNMCIATGTTMQGGLIPWVWTVDILQCFIIPWSCSSSGRASENNHSYPAKNMDKRIAEQEKNIAEILKNLQLIQSVVTAHHPRLGNTTGPK